MRSALQTTHVLSSQLSMYCMIYIAANLSITCGLRSFPCANQTIAIGSGKLFKNNLMDVQDNIQTCWTLISVSNASVVELRFQMFYTRSYGDLNFINDMCSSEYLEITTSVNTFRICGNWIGKEHLLKFVFSTTYIYIRFYSNNFDSKSGFKLQWMSVFDNELWLPDKCVYPIFESSTSCFEFVDQPQDWLTSHNDCRKRGATLARVDDPDTHLALTRNLINKYVALTIHTQQLLIHLISSITQICSLKCTFSNNKKAKLHSYIQIIYTVYTMYNTNRIHYIQTKRLQLKNGIVTVLNFCHMINYNYT